MFIATLIRPRVISKATLQSVRHFRVSVSMPDIGEDCTLDKFWHDEGTKVHEGDVICELSNVKGNTFLLQSHYTGIIVDINKKQGDTIKKTESICQLQVSLWEQTK